MLFGKRIVPEGLKVFADLPVRKYAVGPAAEWMAVRILGTLGDGRTPLVCVPGDPSSAWRASGKMAMAAMAPMRTPATILKISFARMPGSFVWTRAIKPPEPTAQLTSWRPNVA